MTYHQRDLSSKDSITQDTSHPILESRDTHPIRNSSDKEIRDKQHEDIEIR